MPLWIDIVVISLGALSARLLCWEELAVVKYSPDSWLGGFVSPKFFPSPTPPLLHPLHPLHHPI